MSGIVCRIFLNQLRDVTLTLDYKAKNFQFWAYYRLPVRQPNQWKLYQISLYADLRLLAFQEEVVRGTVQSA
jgi:hypothetical protein